MVRPYVYKCHIGLCTPRRTLMDSKKKKKILGQREIPHDKLGIRYRAGGSTAFYISVRTLAQKISPSYYFFTLPSPSWLPMRVRIMLGVI